MPIQKQQFNTITCDAPECDKTITFEVTQNGIDPAVIEANPWMKTNSVVSTADNRVFSFCSTLCLVKAASAGLFDPVEPKQVQPVQGSGIAAVAAAAAEARRKAQADQNIRDGKPAQVQIA